ncbi:MAG: trypsin-like peptidase domain-containing protein [Clostridia bacterium]|nr:trypsin-like peptidase domain-containing protein [Clostridia bacterium]
MSDEWNWGQDPKETDDAAQQSAPEEDLNENVTYHYKYTSSRNGGNTGNTDNGNYYASGRNYQNTSGNTTGDTAGSNIGNEAGEPSSEPKYAHYQVDEQEKKPEEEPKRRHHRHQTDGKPESGFGKKAGNTITLAVLFGLVAGLVFQAVNVVSDKYFKKETPATVGTAETLTSFVAAGDTGESTTDSSTSDSTNADAVANTKGPVAGVAQAAMPSVVAITSVSMQEIRSFFGYGMEYPSTGSGSGIIVGENDDELLIATNNHVVEGATTLSVCFIGSDVVNAEQETENYVNGNGDLNIDGAVSAKIKGTDEDTDLAVIAVEKSDIPQETMDQIKIAQLGNSDDLAVGEQVVAIGNALGYGQTVTSGWVSALERTVQSDSNTYEDLIQTDAAINPGNSGGALLNMQGELIGINCAKIASSSVEGTGYAIPISKAQPILEELMNRKTRDKVSDESQVGYLGIKFADLSREAIQMYNMPSGAFVMYVAPGEAADIAGIRKSDIITKLDGQKVSSKADINDKLQYYSAGEEIEIQVARLNDGEYEEETVNVTLSARPDSNQ